jgi:hypothetical protein
MEGLLLCLLKVLRWTIDRRCPAIDPDFPEDRRSFQSVADTVT